MALFGDGNGIVTIPNATATGDFSIVFSAITITTGTEIIIGDNTAGDNFIATFTTGTVSTRIDGDNTTQTATTAGEIIKYEITRTSGAVQVLVDDVIFSNHSFAGTFVLDTFFTYNSGSLKGSMTLGGTCFMSGFTGAGDRSYNFEGTGTTLVDTISAENGTLSGFTTGGFGTPVVPSGIAINSVSDFDGIHWDTSGQAVFTISGTCDGVTTVEYSFDEVNWFTLDASPTTTFTGTVTVTHQQNVTVRDSGDVGVNDKVLNLTAGPVIPFWWQSNTEGRLINNQTITVTGNNPIPVMYKLGVFSEMTDPTGIEGGSMGSLLPLIAQRYSDAGIPVIMANVAKGSTSIDYWNGNGTTGYGRLQSLFADTGGFEFTLSIGGETDTQGGMSQIDMETKLGNTVDSIFTDFGVQHYLVTFPYGNTTGGDPADMNAAFASTVANNVNCLFGGNLQTIDIDTGTTVGNDGTHIKSDADAALADVIISTALGLTTSSTLNMINTGTPDGTYSMVTWKLSDNSVMSVEDVTFSGGAASIITSLGVGSSVLAFTAGANSPTTGIAYDGVTE